MRQKLGEDEGYTSRKAFSLYSFNTDSAQWAQLALPSDIGAAAVPTMIRVVSWNVDFIADHADHRLQCILDCLQNEIASSQEKETVPCPPCILLQEIEEEAISVILGHEWIRNEFNISPISPADDWHASYGSVTLVHKRIPVTDVSKITFEKSTMGRFALLVDIKLGVSAAAGTGAANANAAAEDSINGGKQEAVAFRLANVHLESLADGARARPRQLGAVALALREAGMLGGLVCGDMNAIQESDKNTPAAVGLVDAFQGDDGPASNTWGYQPPSRFPPGRLDKILYTMPKQSDCSTTSASFIVAAPALVGVGLRVSARLSSGKAVDVWASDHFGLSTTLSIIRRKS